MANPSEYEGLKFILYARKSTTDEKSQACSIEDQIDLCTKFAAMNKINIIDTVYEDQSARYAGKRKVFKQMVTDIKSGKYDAILAYHPDRLARNMMERGIITDMLQPPNARSKVPTLKTLTFPTMSFANDSGGRLLLVIQFVLATNYSDHLSEQVTRGNDKNLVRGTSNGTPKWGYDRDALTGEYTPDKNYDTIKAAWDMAITGASKREGARYIVKNKVFRMSKITRKNKVSYPIYASKNVEHIFTDPFYYGELHQGSDVLNLKEKWSNFKPMIIKEQFLKVQRDIIIRNNNRPVGHKTSIRSDNSRSKDFLPLRGLVRCAECRAQCMFTQAKVAMAINMFIILAKMLIVE